MNTLLDTDIRARVDAFVADLSVLIHQAALGAVQEALGGAPAPARRGPGRPRKAATNGRRKAPGRKAKATKAGGRLRRSAEDLDALAGTVLSHIRSNPGQRLEEIGVAMGSPTSELKRPISKLMEAGSLRTEGQRRGTKYFAGRGGKRKTTKAAARKAGKKRGTRKKAGRRKGGRKRTKKT